MTLPGPAPFLGGQAETFQQVDRLGESALVRLGRVLGQQHPGQGDVLELAQVAEVVIGGQPLLLHPAQRIAHAALRDQHARPDGTDRTHVRGEVGCVQPFRLVQQAEGGVDVSLGHADAGNGDPHAMPVLRQAGVLAQLLGLHQQLSGETEVVVFAVERAHPDVHVGCPPQD